MNHVVLSNSLAVGSGVVSMRMTEQTMKTVPAAETQTSQRGKKKKTYLCVPPAEIMLSEVPERADGVRSKLKASNKNHFQHV